MSRVIGNRAEDRAARFLETRGYTIIERNFRCARGEIDIIAEHEGVLCFVEVRMRQTGRYGLPEESISHLKKRKIAITARHFLAQRHIEDKACRFDVVTIVGEGEPVLQANAYEQYVYKDQ